MAKKKSTVSLLAILKFRCWVKPINSWKTFSFSVCILIKFNMNQKVNLRKFFIAQNKTGVDSVHNCQPSLSKLLLQSIYEKCCCECMQIHFPNLG